MDFITDMKTSHDFELPGGEIMHISRYGLWRYDMAKGKHQVFETSDDLEYLKKKYKTDNVVVIKR